MSSSQWPAAPSLCWMETLNTLAGVQIWSLAALQPNVCGHTEGVPRLWWDTHPPDQPSSYPKPWHSTHKGKGEHHLSGFNTISLISPSHLSENLNIVYMGSLWSVHMLCLVTMFFFCIRSQILLIFIFIHSLVFIIDSASCVNRLWIASLSLFLISWVKCLMQRGPSSLWDGVIWFSYDYSPLCS